VPAEFAYTRSDAATSAFTFNQFGRFAIKELPWANGASLGMRWLPPGLGKPCQHHTTVFANQPQKPSPEKAFIQLENPRFFAPRSPGAILIPPLPRDLNHRKLIFLGIGQPELPPGSC